MQLPAQQLMTSQIRLHVEYLIQTYIFLCLFYTQHWRKI